MHLSIIYLFRFANIPDEWEPPKKIEYKERPHLHHWLLEPDSFDQYSVLNQGNLCQVWLNSLPQPTLLQEKEVRISVVTLLGCVKMERKMVAFF